MAKGFEKQQERAALLNSFGKDLTRRSGSQCELCSRAGVPLAIFEAPPVPEPPEFKSCIFICDTCRGFLKKPGKGDIDHWRCACESVWSDVPAVQVTAARILDRLSKNELWAREALEDVHLDEEIEEWMSKSPM